MAYGHPDAHLVLDEGDDELVTGFAHEGKVDPVFSDLVQKSSRLQ